MNKLTQVFKQNRETDPHTYWQYMATNKGEFVLYPGTQEIYNPNKTNTYDARYRPWFIISICVFIYSRYVASVLPPKDIVILIDGFFNFRLKL